MTMTQLGDQTPHDQTPLMTDDLRPLLNQAVTQLGLAQLALSFLTLKVQAVTGVEVAVTRRMMTTPTTPTAWPTCTSLGGWPEVPEDTGWPTVVGPEVWHSTRKEFSRSSPALSLTVWPTSSNTTSTYRPSLEPSKPGK